jgi:hypothetical protein
MSSRRGKDPECIVPGCRRIGVNDLGIRLRRRDRSAWWARETAAHVCDAHAGSGARITVTYEGTDTGTVEVRTQGATEPIVRRGRAIQR